MPVKVEARAPLEEDIKELLVNLSREDRDELLIQAADPEWAIRHSIDSSIECVAVFGDGELACITGVNRDDGLVMQATPWLLGTEAMKKYPREVLKFSRLMLERWRSQFPFMENYVDARHLRARRWLTFLGANGTLVPEYGPYKKPFYRFTFGVDPCASL